ncbi:MAG: aminoacyl-tRNA hydrolase [Pseudomonadota bacterium]
MLVIVGLGNPGETYAGHRHNLGFMVLDRRASGYRRKFDGAVCESRLQDTRCVYLKPMTYMNESGRSVSQAKRFYRPSAVLVIHDEIDLAPGKVRLKKGGGDGGHRGVRSVANHLGKDFWRLRIGVGHPGHRDRVNPYVMSNFSQEDQGWLEPCLVRITDALPLLADLSQDTARAAFLSQVADPKQAPAPQPPP